MADEKSVIAERAANLIPDGSSLFINIGTTTERVADYLKSHSQLLVITNNMNVATSMWPMDQHEVMVAGGTIRQEDGGIVGPSTEDFIDNFKVDFAVIGCSAIDGAGEVFDYDPREVRVTQHIIQRAASTILVADSMKFSRRAPARICTLNQVDYLVTDDGISDEARSMCAEREIQLDIVDASGIQRPADQLRI